MKTVMGSMNGVWLQNIMAAAKNNCSRVTAAVAYASNNNPFIDHCIENKLFLDYFGLLDEGQAVAIPVLQKMLEAGPLAVNCRLIKGHFHSKIIWWHGFGIYIGSANLTHSAWSSNVECGVFYEESEIVGTEMQVDLEQQFDYLRVNSSALTSELVKALKGMLNFDQEVQRSINKRESQFMLLTKDIPLHKGLAAVGSKTPTTAFTRFTSEWTDTLQLLRGLSKEFQAIARYPTWVSADAEPAVHFDQFLHAYYYVRVRDEKDDEENRKSVDLVNLAHEKNKTNRSLALKEGADWWSNLAEAPYGEDKFIRDTAKFMRTSFSKENLERWVLADFQQTFFEVHAFKTHARQVRNSFFDLPQGYKESAKERSDRLAEWLWTAKREPGQKSIVELLLFLIWGTNPSNAVERLWMVTKNDEWRFDHLGTSSLGEALGWARPDLYPPRNNRTNKALRSLGHEVRLFSD
jgi:hypothetical protein